MSRDVITVGSTMRIPLLYRSEYSQWRERFMNYLEEQTDGEAMINSIQNGDQPLPVIAQVSLAGNAQNAPPTLKDPKFWTAEEKKIRKIDHLARSLLIQVLPNDIYSLIDSNETAKDLWDALERQMRGSEYAKQDRKATILYEYENFKAIEGELLLDTYLCYLQVINDLKKCGYKKDNYELNYKFLNNLQQEWKHELKKVTSLLANAFNRRKFYSKRTNNNLRASSTSQSANKKQEFVKSNDKKEDKKSDEKKRDMSKVKCYNCKKEGHFSKDCKKAKVKDYNYYKTKMLIAKKDSDEQVLLAEDQAWMELKLDESSSSAEETIAEVAYYTSESESESEFETLEYYDNSTNYGLFVNNDDDQEIFHDAIESAERYEYMIRYSALFDNDKQHRKQIADQEVLFDRMSVELVELDKHVRDLKNTVLEKDFKISELEECVRNKNIEIEKCLERIGFENLSYFEKSKDLRPTLYDEKVIGLGYTLMFLTHSNESLEIEKFKRSRENKIEFAYDYGNLNASYVNEKINFEDAYFQEIINLDFEKIDSPFQQTSSLKSCVPNVILEKIIIDLEDEVVSLLEKDKANLKTIESLKSKGFETTENVNFESENQSENDCQVVEKVCNKVENSKVIAPGMFKSNVSQSVSPISMSKSSCESKNVEIKLKRKRHLDTFSSVRRPKNSGVIWKKKGSSNTSNVDLSAVSLSNLNKNVNRYSRKDFLSCNNSHLGETSSAYVCNDAMNISCDSRMNDLLDDNNFFIFDDESVRISPVSKMPFRKKPRDSMNHMMGNRALLTNFVEKFLETVCFGNNDFAVIVGYGDVVIGSMTIKKVYYVEGLGHNLFRVGQFCEKGLEIAFRKST
nr:integrase, catalytic region, zinc finger, CCHC-type, peptidase aspartic, catalytic [Tanacetum cinerariifolium]